MKSKEIWLPIYGFEGLYSVSNHGRIKSHLRTIIKKNNLTKRVNERIIKQATDIRGYKYCILCKQGLKKHSKVHRLIATAFIENTENKPHINHINGIPSDNRIENLQWCTHAENMRHAKNMNRHKHGENHYMSKLSVSDVRKIKDLLSEGIISQTEIGLIYGVHRRTIGSIKSGHSWTRV